MAWKLRMVFTFFIELGKKYETNLKKQWRCDRGCVAWKAWNICSLTLYGEGLLNPGLKLFFYNFRSNELAVSSLYGSMWGVLLLEYKIRQSLFSREPSLPMSWKICYACPLSVSTDVGVCCLCLLCSQYDLNIDLFYISESDCVLAKWSRQGICIFFFICNGNANPVLLLTSSIRLKLNVLLENILHIDEGTNCGEGLRWWLKSQHVMCQHLALHGSFGFTSWFSC